MSGTLIRRGRSAHGMDTPRDVDWRRLAPCKSDPDAWSVCGTRKLDTANVRAVLTCRRCPVLRECDEWATAHPPTGMIAAGKVWLSPETGAVPVVDSTCRRCGQRFMSIGRADECARACLGKRRSQSTLTKVCDHCGAQFQTSSRGRRYCGPTCKLAARRGSKEVSGEGYAGPDLGEAA